MKDEEVEQRIASLHSEYGVKFDRMFFAMTEVIKKEVVAGIKDQDRPVYQMANNKQAFLYGLGKNLWLAVTVICITVLSLVWYFYISDNYRYREASVKSLSREQQLGLETFKGLILTTWGTGRITTFTPQGSTTPIDVLMIPKSTLNKIAAPGMSYYEDNVNVYIRIK